MGPFGWSEMLFIFFIALIIFGPKKLPELGKTLGKGLREFRKASDDLKSSWEEHIRDAESPLRDLKQTIRDVQDDVVSSASVTTEKSTAPALPEAKPDTRTDAESRAGEADQAAHDVETSAGMTTVESTTPASEETQSDAHTN